MSIASRITSIEGHIEDDYNALTRLGADLTNVDKNIENIASVVNDIYDKLPKVTGTGSDLSLTPTLKGGLSILPLGNCEQSGTPTPDNPIDVKVVTGDNQVVVANKNLVSSSLRSGNIIFLNGTTLQDYNIDYKFKAGTYTFSFVNSNNPNIYINGVNKGNIKPLTFTMTEDFNIWLYRNGMTDNETTSIQLEVGSTATSYVAHQEQSTTLHLDGNIFDKTNLIDGWVRGSNGNYETTYGTTYCCTDFLEVQPNQAYIIDLYNYTGLDSGGFVEYNSSKQYIKSTPETQRIVTFTTTENTKYIRFTVRKDSINNVIYAIGNTLPTPIELCKIGDYQDVITGTKDNWKVVRKVGHIVSYNGETISTDYISTTGELSTGAEVYYGLSISTEETITDTTLINELNGLQELLSYDGTTNITITSASNNAQMLVQVSALKGE